MEGEQTGRLDRDKERKDKNRDTDCNKEKEDTAEGREDSERIGGVCKGEDKGEVHRQSQ